MKTLAELEKEAGGFPFKARFSNSELVFTITERRRRDNVYLDANGGCFPISGPMPYWKLVPVIDEAEGRLQGVSFTAEPLPCSCDFSGANAWAGCRCGAFKKEQEAR